LVNEAPRSKLRGIKAELRRSPYPPSLYRAPDFIQTSTGQVGPAHLAFLSGRHVPSKLEERRGKLKAKSDHPCCKQQGIQAKANQARFDCRIIAMMSDFLREIASKKVLHHPLKSYNECELVFIHK